MVLIATRVCNQRVLREAVNASLKIGIENSPCTKCTKQRNSRTVEYTPQYCNTLYSTLLWYCGVMSFIEHLLGSEGSGLSKFYKCLHGIEKDSFNL